MKDSWYLPQNIDLTLFVGTQKEFQDQFNDEDLIIGHIDSCINLNPKRFVPLLDKIHFIPDAGISILWRYPETKLIYPELQSFFLDAIIEKAGDNKCHFIIQTMSFPIIRDCPSHLGLDSIQAMYEVGTSDKFFSRYGRKVLNEKFEYVNNGRTPIAGEEAAAEKFASMVKDDIIRNHLLKVMERENPGPE